MELYGKNLDFKKKENYSNPYYANYNNFTYNNPNYQNYQTNDKQGKISMTMMSPQVSNLQMFNQNKINTNDLDPETVLKAMNQSYTQRMSGAPVVQLMDILALVSKTA